MTAWRWPDTLGLWTAVTVVGAVCAATTAHPVLAGGLLLFGAAHCWRLGRRWLVVPVAAVAVWAGCFAHWQQQVRPPAENRSQSVAITVFPSRLKVNGDLVSGRAVTTVTGQPVWLAYQFQTAEEKAAFTALTGPMTVRGQGTLTGVAGPTNPGQFDFRCFAAAQYGISTQLTMKKGEWTPVSRPHNLSYVNYIGERLRLWLDHKLASLPAHLQVYVRGLILGGGSSGALARDLRETQTKLGIIHLWSLSGMQVMLLASVLLLVSTWLRLPYERARWLVLGILLLYGLITDWPTGVTRSVAMFAAAHLWPRRWAVPALDRMGVVLLLWLFWRPAAFTQLGSLLSFFLAFCLYFAPRRFWQQSVVINVISLPFILAFQFEWQPLTLLLNILLIPVFNYVFFPVMLAVTAAVLADWPVGFTGLELLLTWFDDILEKLAAGAWGTVATGAVPAVVFAGLLISALVVSFVPAGRRWALASGAVLVIGLCCSRVFPFNERVAFIDVGQGDSSLIIARGGGPRVLVDTGGRVDFTRAPWQTRDYAPGITYNVLPVLRYYGIRRLDAVFLSHQDADHMGDLGPLLAAVRVDRIFMEEMSPDRDSGHNKKKAPQPWKKYWGLPIIQRQLPVESGGFDLCTPHMWLFLES